MKPRDLIDDLRSRINPAYASQVGTESWERRLCVEALEAQAGEIERLRAVADAARAVLRYPSGVDAVPYQRMQALARAVQAVSLTEPGGE